MDIGINVKQFHRNLICLPNSRSLLRADAFSWFLRFFWMAALGRKARGRHRKTYGSNRSPSLEQYAALLQRSGEREKIRLTNPFLRKTENRPLHSANIAQHMPHAR